MRLLWTTRKPVSEVQLQLGLEAWRALTNPDPRPLAAIVRRGTPGRPDGDWLRRVLGMEATSAPVFTRSPGLDREGKSSPPATDVVVITELGRSVLRGEVDFRSLNPLPRWVGGVPIQTGVVGWRWDEVKRDAVFREGNALVHRI